MATIRFQYLLPAFLLAVVWAVGLVGCGGAPDAAVDDAAVDEAAVDDATVPGTASTGTTSTVDATVPGTASTVDATVPGTASTVDATVPGTVDAVDETTIVFLGDSLTAGFGVAEEEAYPALVEARLRAEGRATRVVNAGVSGDTTAGGLGRLDWILRQRPDLVVVVLGGNDGLRGLDLEASEENLRRIVATVRAADARVLLGGMMLPPSYGEDYIRRFAAIYPRLAEELDVALVPFVLEGVGGVAALNQADGIHPNAAGQKVLATTVLEHLRPLLDEIASSKGIPPAPG